MIQYNNENQFTILCQFTGSVLPRCLPVGIFTGGLGLALAILRKNSDTKEVLQHEDYITATLAMQIMGVVIGYLLVMRTNMALNRWMHAISQVEVMLAKWSDAYNVLNSFFSGKKGTEEVLERILLFRIRVAHWFSLMSCLAFSTLTDGHVTDLRRVLIEPRYPEGSEKMPFSGRGRAKDPAKGTSWKVLHAPTEEEVQILEHCSDHVNMVALWIIQGIMLEVRAQTLDAPAPILTRVFQEISIGMLGFHQAHKVAMVPFPFPFAQMVSILLMALCIFLPFYIDCFTKHVIITPAISAIVPICYCGLNVLAVELEVPFTRSKNAVDLDEFNEAFLGLLEDTILMPQVPPSSEFARLEREIIQGVEFTYPPEDNVPREGQARSPMANPTSALEAAPWAPYGNEVPADPTSSMSSRKPRFGSDGFTVKRVNVAPPISPRDEPSLREGANAAS